MSENITNGLLVRNVQDIWASENQGYWILKGQEFTVIATRGRYADLRHFDGHHDRDERVVHGVHVDNLEPVPGPEGLRSMLRIG